MKRSLENNIRAIYLLGFFTGFLVVVPVFVPLLQGYGLSMSQVMQTQALFALTIALCEVPSGYIADIWGRRNAILVGSACNALGFFSLLWADSFVDFLIYEFILGVGFSLISGADLALLYDTEVYLRERGIRGGPGASKSLSRLISVEAAASGAAGIAASLLLLWSMDGVVIVQAFTGFAPFLLALLLIEAPRPKAEKELNGHSDNARRIVDLLLFGKPVVFWTAFAITVFGLLAVYVFWIYQKYWELQGVPLEYFGYIWAAFALTVSLSARFSDALEQRLGYRQVMVLIAILALTGLLGMALGAGWLGVIFGLTIQISRGLSMSLFYEALNQRVPGEFRATVNSLVSLGVRSTFIVTGPLLGIALDTQGMQATLMGLLAIFTPLMGLVLVPLVVRIRREKAEEALQASTQAAAC
ncbi:MAG: MFS transporter [Halioglobus sp.]|nr:transporter, major facilitator family [marine gamma proteobacterium HTCC2148]MDG1387173.1 MFS transporter [Halioglobus sp.]MDG2328382.1 MFS transporter [Halioglobus sp.]